MDDDRIVSALISDRSAFDRLAGRLDPTDFNEYAKLIVRNVADFYRNDERAESCDLAVLESALRRQFPDPKHADSVVRYLYDLPASESAKNIAGEYRALRRHKVGLELAAVLAAGKHGDATDALIERYRELGVEQENEADKLTLDELASTAGSGNRIRLLPARLNKTVGGGVLRGHNITIFGRPESGKTAFAVNMAAGFLRQGLRVLYTGNEEPVRDLQLRFLARLSGLSLDRLRAEAEAVFEAGERANGPYELLLARQLSTGKLAEVESLVRQKRPDVLVVDQLKNLKAPGAGNRADELDNIAREIRRLGIAYNLVTVSVTQAGGEADGRLFLEQGDIEWSNTGIPGAADLLIGIGVNKEYDRLKKRQISLPKNKINGNHNGFIVWCDFAHSAVRSKPRRKEYN